MDKNREVRDEFLTYSLDRGALGFGKFTLKSKRISPYFFNSGMFGNGAGLALLGRAYASTIVSKAPNFDVLYGPAYKGIPLASVTAVALWQEHGLNVEVVYNRKETKGHGEGGLLIGGDVKGKKVLIIDDVMTAGTAVGESVKVLRSEGDDRTTIVGAVIGMDRQERGKEGERSAVQEVSETFGFPVFSIVSFSDLLAVVESGSGPVSKQARPYLDAMKKYRDQYGV